MLGAWTRPPSLLTIIEQLCSYLAIYYCYQGMRIDLSCHQPRLCPAYYTDKPVGDQEKQSSRALSAALSLTRWPHHASDLPYRHCVLFCSPCASSVSHVVPFPSHGFNFTNRRTTWLHGKCVGIWTGPSRPAAKGFPIRENILEPASRRRGSFQWSRFSSSFGVAPCLVPPLCLLGENYSGVFSKAGGVEF